MNDTIIVITGAAPLDPRVVATLPESAIVLAADGALDHAREAGLIPAGLIGDLDSVSAEGLEWAEAHATIHRHEPDKDHTDTELALAVAVELDPARLVLVSGGGDRLDHTIAAIGALGHPSLTSIPLVQCWWGTERLAVLHGPGRVAFDVPIGSTLSLLALHGPCSGVSTSGVRWPLDGAELAPVAGQGLSNEAVADEVEIAVSSGVLTIFLPITAEPSS